MLRPAWFTAFSIFLLLTLTQYAEAVGELVELKEEESITKKLSMNRAGILGDAYDPISGSVSFAVTDISIPGNSDLKVELRRKFDVPRTNGLLEMGAWSLDIPSITGYFLGAGDGSGSVIVTGDGWHNGKVCTRDAAASVSAPYYAGEGSEYPLPESYWSGKSLHIPGETSEAFLAGTGTFAGKQITKSNYYISSCPQRADGLGEAIVVSAPDGKKYTFGYSVDEPFRNSPSHAWRYRKVMLVTKVEDQFGNIVNYAYEGKYLKSISSPTDGRSIVLNYVAYSPGSTFKKLDNVVANGKTWGYVYGTAYNQLSSVILPDGSKWTYSPEFYNQREATTITYGNTSQQQGYCEKASNATQTIGFSVSTPEGVTVNYTVKDIYHGRSNVPVMPNNSLSPFPTFKMYDCQVRSNLIAKTVSGPKLETQNWSYAYSENHGVYEGYTNIANSHATAPYGTPASVSNLQAIKTTTVNGPDTRQVYYINRDAQSELENKVVATDTIARDTSALVARTENYYEKGAQVGEWWKLFYTAYNADQRKISNISTTEHRVNPSKTIQRIYNSDGTDTYTTEYSEVNLYGESEKKKESNSFSSAIRYQKQGYMHDSTNWVLNLPTLQQLSTDGTTWTSVAETTYYPWSQGGGYKLQAKEQKSFGNLQKTFTAYHADGNIKKVQYNAADRWVEYSDFYRGKARTVSVPGRYIPTAINSFVREVNGDGTTASVTDLKGNKTIFSYDNGFRLSGVNIVDPLWTDSSVTYDYLTAADATLGVVAGQLKQTLTRGNYEKTTFYDALLRPTLVRERDLSSPTTTTRYTNSKYNAKGELVFTSVPSTSALETLGTETAYDALGRVKTIKEIATGNSKTITYLTGNKQQSKDFKGNTTITSYRAFGTPDTKIVTKIEQPNSVTTTLDYNLFGNILSATQGGFTTSYIYDSKQQLCKLVRPEVGATYYDYTTDGDMLWEAQGITSATTTCDRNLVTEDKKISYQYDNQGDLWKTLYPDTTPDKTATLDANGNPVTLSFGSDSWVYTFNSQNLVETETLNVGGKSFLLDPSYNSLGQVNSLRYPSGKVVAMPKNALGQTKSLASYVSNVTYHPSGAVKTMTYGNGVTVSKDLNNRQLPSTVIVSKSDGTKLSDLYYGYDANANVDIIQDNVKTAYTMSMSYDGLDRLKTASGYWGTGSFDYDTLGNIKTKTLGSDSLTYNYDTRNRLASVIGYKTYLFDYDSRGNVVENGYNPFTYNLANQMTQTNGISYQYDAYGRRIVKSKNGKNSYSFYDKSGLLLYRQKENGDHINYLYVGKDLVTTLESR